MSADEFIGDRIHQILWRNRIRQGELADALGVNKTNVSKKLRGERTWTIDELLVVGRFLGVPITDLLPGDDYAPELRGRGRKVMIAGGGAVGQYAIRDSNPEPADLRPRRGRLALIVSNTSTTRPTIRHDRHLHPVRDLPPGRAS